eukprot:1655063-Rhodomonas_salina.2
MPVQMQANQEETGLAMRQQTKGPNGSRCPPVFFFPCGPTQEGKSQNRADRCNDLELCPELPHKPSRSGSCEHDRFSKFAIPNAL